MSRQETSTIGTTGMKPRTEVPPEVRASRSSPPADQTTVGGPGAGAGTIAWKAATATTPAADQTVTAKAPHFVLHRQKRAATSRGARAANPVKAYWTAREKMLTGARRVTAQARNVIRSAEAQATQANVGRAWVTPACR